jgi:phage-related protein
MMKKNTSKFFLTAPLSVVAVFIFFLLSAPHANAYLIGSSTGQTPIWPTASSTPTSTYDVGSSLQNLFSPFSSFIDSLKFTNSTTINIHGTSAPLPSLNITPVLENILTSWLTQFDNWFYGLTGVRLSGIVFFLLNIFSYVLNFAQKVVNWLLGLFH